MSTASLVALAKRVWANRTVERATWTAAEAAVGFLIARYSGSVVAGVSAGAVLLFVKEAIIAKLTHLSGV